MTWEFVGRTDLVESVLETIGSGESVLLTGEAGVGKSRLAAEIAERSASDMHILNITGSPSLEGISFGAVSQLLVDVPSAEPAMLIALTARALKKAAGDLPFLAVVDDINHLDAGSLGLVQQLMIDESVVVATSRTESATDPMILSLWKDEILGRVEVPPLDERETLSLAEGILGAQVGQDLANELWRLTEGHPLLVRELIRAGIESGSLTRRDSTFHLASPMEPSARILDLFDSRLTTLDEQEFDALAVVSLAGPIRLGAVRSLVADSQLHALEDKGLVGLAPNVEEPALRTAHPLIAEAAAARLGELTRISVAEKAAWALIETPPLSPVDAMRASIWVLDAGGSPPAEVLNAGAQAALHAFDPTLALRLAEAAWAAEETNATGVIRARALAAAGNVTEAERLLTHLWEEADADEEAGRAASALAEMRMFSQDPGGAIDVIEKALAEIDNPSSRIELTSHLMLAAGMVGDFELALRAGPTIEAGGALPRPVELGLLMAITLAQSMTGKLDKALNRLDRADPLAEEHDSQLPFVRDQLGLNRTLVLHAMAQFDEASAFVDSILRAGSGMPGPWHFMRCIAATMTGDLAVGSRSAELAVEDLSSFDPLGMFPMANNSVSLMAAMAKRRSAEPPPEHTPEGPGSAQVRVTVWKSRADSWGTARTGHTLEAANTVRRAGVMAVEKTHHVWGAMALFDAVRFGHPELVVEDLASLAADDRGPLIALMADHATAAAAGDVAGLVSVANAWGSGGATALMVDAFAAASRQADAHSVRHRHLAFHHADRCAEAWFPLLVGLDRPLTDRQSEIAALAASGLRSKEIAEVLHLSSRTVDNHLRATYRILSISDRESLAEFFPEPA